MTLNKISLAVLAATFVAGSAVVANAESSINGSGSGATGAFTSSTMMSNWQDHSTAAQAPAPASQSYAHQPRQVGAKGVRASAKAKHHN